jgi:hypothetical protein
MRYDKSGQFKQALRQMEHRGTASADRLFEAQLKLLQKFLPKSASRRRCPRCGARKVYNQEFDADLCPACNRWLERKCSDAGCSYCSKRPAKPLPRSARRVVQIVRPAKTKKAFRVRLPREFLDEITAQCEQAGRARSQRKHSGLVTPLLVSGVFGVCPRRVRLAITSATARMLFGLVPTRSG